MKVHSIRRITHDRRHNAFTGACWFKGDLYVGYRQGDDHVCQFGRIVVLRSRDKGITWDTVAVFRAEADTRDAALYTDGTTLFAVSFAYDRGAVKQSGCGTSDDGDHWTTWEPYEGTGDFVLWRPVWHEGKHYCAGYKVGEAGGVHWFESDDGHTWADVRTIHESAEERPTECYLEISDGGDAVMLMRCDIGPTHPYLCRSSYPFDEWELQRLTDVHLTGPALWMVDDRVYIGGRWKPQTPRLCGEPGHVAHTAIFRVTDGKTYLLCVLPSGPHPDHSYMGVAGWPDDPKRFAISFYSNAIGHEDPAIDQWIHPDIYLADVSFYDE